MHICVQTECESIDKLNGLHFICYLCRKKTFATCAIESSEVNMILRALNIIVVDNKGTIKAKVTDESKTDFDLMFGGSSHFSYTCNQCTELKMLDALKKSLTDKNVAIKNLNEANTSIQKSAEIEISGKNEEINQLQNNIQELLQQIDEKNNLIKELTEANDTPNNVTENGIQLSGSDDDVTHVNFNEMSKQLMKNMNEVIESELEKISSKVAHECENIKDQCSKLLNEYDNKNKSSLRVNPFSRTNNTKRNVTFQTQLNSEENGNGNDEQIETEENISFNDKLIPVTHNTETRKDTPEQQNNKHTTFNDKLNPSINSNKQEVYAIHVSRFPLNVTIDDITAHIMNNTKLINPDTFKVQRLDKQDSDFISFKISTLQHTAYKMIMNIWKPFYTARNFNGSPHNNKKTPMQALHKFQANRQMNETPRQNQRLNNVTPHRKEYQRYNGKDNNNRSNSSFNKRSTHNQYNNNYKRMNNDRERVNYNQQQQPNKTEQQQTQQEQQNHQPQIVVLPYQSNATNAMTQLQTAFLGSNIVQPPIQPQYQHQPQVLQPIQFVHQQQPQPQQQWLPQVQTYLQQ